MQRAGIGILLIGLGVMGVRVDAHATGRLADVQVIDRDTGSVLPMYRSRGEYWRAAGVRLAWGKVWHAPRALALCGHGCGHACF